MNYICSWFCADKKGEESDFPQSGMKSSGAAHQNIYWRCLLVFYMTSIKHNKSEKHVLFTNVDQLPVVDGRNIADLLEDLNVQVVHVDFNYKTPQGYFGSFQNQFFEFSIIEWIARHAEHENDMYLILDSDCVFNKPVHNLFRHAMQSGHISFALESPLSHSIQGLTREDMRKLFTEISGKPCMKVPAYHLGEFFLCNVKNIRKLYADFLVLWPELLRRHAEGLPKFNEEAHTLSYLYFLNGWEPSKHAHFIRRIWTNPVFYRNVKANDQYLNIWHLPAEKKFGIKTLYDKLMRLSARQRSVMPEDEFRVMVRRALGIPAIKSGDVLRYYSSSYYSAIRKRFMRILSA